MFKMVKRFLRKGEQGASMVEYALLLALIAVFALVALQLLGTEVSKVFSTITNAITEART